MIIEKKALAKQGRIVLAVGIIVLVVAIGSVTIGSVTPSIMSENKAEWQLLEIPEQIIGVVSIKGINYALSDNARVYTCPSIPRENKRCANSRYPEDVDFVTQEITRAGEDISACTLSIEEPLSRLFSHDDSIVACTFTRDHSDQSVNLAFIVDEAGNVWRWLPIRDGLLETSVSGIVLGSVIGLGFLAFYVVISGVIRLLG